MTTVKDNLPITVIIAAKNEEANIARCISSLNRAERIIVVDSHSNDATAQFSKEHGAEVFQFDYQGGYPKKRQWAMDNIPIHTEWILLLDADEVIPNRLWEEIQTGIALNQADAFLIKKGFHFMGKPFRFGGFSHSAILLFRKGKARFEHVLDEPPDAVDMEVHERLLVDGKVARFKTPLIHQDFKGLEAYIDRHNKYSLWEARVRYQFLKTGEWGKDPVKANAFGNIQEKRRFLKSIVCRLPFEHIFWFFYHYIICLGILEGRCGLIACRIRSNYIAEVRAKLYEMKIKEAFTKANF